MKFFEGLRERNVTVRILTNSLASTDMSIVHSGYQAFREPLLDKGVDLYEVRPVLGQPVVRGNQLKSPSSGRYALHAKVFVFDRQRVFIGSMNLDQRSLYLNTEIGLIIDSPELARQIALRFEDIAQPANSYVLMLSAGRRIRATPSRLAHARRRKCGRLRRGTGGHVLAARCRSTCFRCCRSTSCSESTTRRGAGNRCLRWTITPLSLIWKIIRIA